MKAVMLVIASATKINVNADGNSGIVDDTGEDTTTFPYMPRSMCPGNVHT